MWFVVVFFFLLGFFFCCRSWRVVDMWKMWGWAMWGCWWGRSSLSLHSWHNFTRRSFLRIEIFWLFASYYILFAAWFVWFWFSFAAQGLFSLWEKVGEGQRPVTWLLVNELKFWLDVIWMFGLGYVWFRIIWGKIRGKKLGRKSGRNEKVKENKK